MQIANNWIKLLRSRGRTQQRRLGSPFPLVIFKHSASAFKHWGSGPIVPDRVEHP